MLFRSSSSSPVIFSDELFISDKIFSSLVCVWRVGSSSGSHAPRTLQLEKALSAHSGTITCLHICQPYMVNISGSDDCTVELWDLSSLGFIRQLPVFASPVSAFYLNELTGEIVTATGIMLAVWSINGDYLSVVNTSQLSSDFIVSVTTCTFSDWLETNSYVSGHQSCAVKVWQMVHTSRESVTGDEEDDRKQSETEIKN
ncbi:putative transcription factor WD40-like family [Helianthus annuus]|nr:putative transcription factor WD40-like family [Helianthus annuus]